MTKQLWLGAPECSMRGVRYRMLSPTEVDSAAASAALGGSGMTLIAYQSAYQRAGTIAMLVAYTEPLLPVQDGPDEKGTMPALQDPDLNKASWKTVDHTQMEVSFGKGEIFNAKDASILQKIFMRTHEANMSEVDMIMGKATTAP